jgi:hypothetical protein
MDVNPVAVGSILLFGPEELAGCDGRNGTTEGALVVALSKCPYE